MRELKDTIVFMTSKDYKERLFGEYHQTKIRYEKLKALLNKWDAYNDYKYHIDNWEQETTLVVKHLEDFLGFIPHCSYDILKEQQAAMGQYLHCLEVRAAIEEIDL